MPSTCWNLTATTCAASRGRTGAWKLARLLRGAGHGVQLSDHMESTDGDAMFRHACAIGRWRASSPSATTGRIDPGVRPIGSRSRIRTHLDQGHRVGRTRASLARPIGRDGHEAARLHRATRRRGAAWPMVARVQ